ncbi:hypothetical protein [Kutzneria albida]|uniref:Putative secreted protein n=1 Tax=Kutzneria albida DSM 43870 TaxID=1449976 RepID=W5VZX9_9PSEU|nr:hypothetical protein [Kutzneria albida]AHH94060.1 putative secreted protein [Kutzneria albida DSM 43870]
MSTIKFHGFALLLATATAGLLPLCTAAPASAATQKGTSITASGDSAALCLKPAWGMIN